MAYRVFISATLKDTDLARDLSRRLKEVGVEVHSVGNVAAGESISGKIIRALNDVDEVLVLLTDNSVTSSWLMYEMGAASSLRKRVTPVIVGLEKSELPSIIKSMKYIKYPDLSKYISDLERRAKAA